jgi:hypothetical protein
VIQVATAVAAKVVVKLAQASVHLLVAPQISRDRISSESNSSTCSSGNSDTTHAVYSCECSSCQRTIEMCMLTAASNSPQHKAQRLEL